ncbi:peroxiredoxin [Prochlorococcus sp. MIT 1300]|uniref:peroxiredoxin n=1 Tax=Prochlorococcus sp. MIT 1300 TaxID=3096218 RepID=UPI002A7561E2|nr:peroxiredoxin [Prochlorococcus sp. MIT 1300]
MVLHTGDKAPGFALKDQDGVLRRLDDAKGKYLILFFYPKDNTPGCTAEACSFRDNIDKFKPYKAELWGVSGDNEESHKLFAERYSLSFPLLCDTNNMLRSIFKVPKTLGLVPGRVTYVIDPQQRICHVFNNLLDGPSHVNEALRFLENASKRK